MPNSVNHSVNSMTMHRVGRDGLEAVNCRASGVKDGDAVFFVFGEIDCRCHIEKQIASGREYGDVLKQLVESYLTTITTNCKEFFTIYPVVVSVVPPVSYADFLSANPPLSDDHGFPFVGSNERRVKITKDLNEALKIGCKSRGYHFLDIHDHYARSEDGTLKFELSDRICHVKDNSYILDRATKLMLTLCE